MGSVHGSAGQPVACRSILGDAREATPLVLPIRGDLEDIQAMMQGDVYIGRGCRQRGLKRSLYCNNYEVASYGRQSAIEHFEKHLLSSTSLYAISHVSTLFLMTEIYGSEDRCD